MEEILEKQVKKFVEGFDDDNIMRLIVGFESNLKNIFSQIKQN
jgi:enoyl-[acyl-carrier-protein] reductase (NADH)